MPKTLSALVAFAIVGLPGKPAGVAAVDGGQSGQVAVSWQGVEGAAFYRIGWVAYDEITAVRNAGRPWVDAFAF